MSQTAEERKKASFSEKEFLSRATPMMRSVYEQWSGNPVIAEDLRKAVQNKEKVMEFWRQKHEGVEAELAPYAERLADALISAFKAGGLAAAKRAAFEFFSREKYGERKLADRLLPDASEALQHERGAMLKFSRLPLFTCPGADVCGAHCYAIHGHYAKEPVKDAILRQDAFIQLLERSSPQKYQLFQRARAAALLLLLPAAGIGSTFSSHRSTRSLTSLSGIQPLTLLSGTRSTASSWG